MRHTISHLEKIKLIIILSSTTYLKFIPIFIENLPNSSITYFFILAIARWCFSRKSSKFFNVNPYSDNNYFYSSANFYCLIVNSSLLVLLIVLIFLAVLPTVETNLPNDVISLRFVLTS